MVAKAFGVLPSAAARDLDEDPEQLSLLCLPLLNYSDMKGIFDEAMRRGSDGDKMLAPYADSELMMAVRRNTLDLRRERVEHLCRRHAMA